MYIFQKLIVLLGQMSFFYIHGDKLYCRVLNFIHIAPHQHPWLRTTSLSQKTKTKQKTNPANIKLKPLKFVDFSLFSYISSKKQSALRGRTQLLSSQKKKKKKSWHITHNHFKNKETLTNNCKLRRKKTQAKDDQLDTFSQASHWPENCIHQGKFQLFLNSSSLFINCN